MKAVLRSGYFWLGCAGAFFFIFLLFSFLNRTIFQPIKEQIQKKAESFLPTHEIKIGKLSTNFLTFVSLSPVEISNPGGFRNGAFFKAEKVKVQIQLWKMLSQRLYTPRPSPSPASSSSRPHPNPLPEGEGERVRGEGIGKGEGILGMPLNRGELGAISVHIQKPFLFLTRKDGEWLKPNLKKGEGPLLPITIQWSEGEATVNDTAAEWDGTELKNWSGTLGLTLPAVSLQTSLETPLSGEMEKKEKFNFFGTLDSGKNLSAKISLNNLQIGKVLPFLTTLPENLAFDGGINSDLEIQGNLQTFSTPPDLLFASLTTPRLKSGTTSGGLQQREGHREWLKNWKVSGKIQPENLAIRWGGKENLPALKPEGEIKFSHDSIETSEFKLVTSSSELKISGSILSPLATPQIQSQVSGTFQLAEWLPIVNGSPLPARGNGEISLQIMGDLKSPDGIASLKISDSLLLAAPFSLESKIEFHKGKGRLETFTGSWGEGKIKGSGSVQKEKMEINVRLMGANLAGVSLSKKQKITGKLFGQWHFKGAPFQPKVSGRISLSNFILGKERFGNLTGFIAIDKNLADFRLLSSDRKNRMSLQIQGWGKNFHNAKASLLLAENQKLDLNAAVDHSTRKLTGKVSANKFSLSRLSILSDIFSHFEGGINGNGELEGTVENPILRGRLSSSRIQVHTKRDGKTIRSKENDLQSTFYWDRTSFEFSNLRIGKFYEGAFRYFKKPVASFFAQGKATGGDPKILFALLNAPTAISGKIHGEFLLTHKKNPDLKKQEAAWEGAGELKILSGQWGETPFEEIYLKYDINREKVGLHQFRIRQKEGSLIVSGNSEQRQPENPMELKAQAKNFLLAENRINGEFVAEGLFQILPEEILSGTVHSKDFSFNQLQSGTLKGDVQLNKEALLLDNFIWGDDFRGSGGLQFGQEGSPKISGTWSSQMARLEDWSKFFRIKLSPARGKMALSGTVSGTLSEMEHSLMATFSDLTFIQEGGEGGAGHGNGFSGSAKWTLSKGIVKSLKANMRTKDGGRWTLLGQANLNSKILEMETSFANLDAQNFLGTHSQWGTFTGGLLRGRMKGQLSIRGAWDEPVIKGEVVGSAGSFGEIPLDLWEISGSFRKKEIQLVRLNFIGRKGSWRFSILEDSWVKPEDGTNRGSFNLAADFANLPIGPLSLVGISRFQGTWKKVPGSEAPFFEGNLKLNETLANNVELYPVELKVQYHDGKLKLIPHPTYPLLRLEVGVHPSPEGNSLLKHDPALGGTVPSREREKGKRPISSPKISGEIDFTGLPCIHFKNLAVEDSEKQIFHLNGVVCPEKPSFEMEGKDLNASLIFGFLEIPGAFTGKTKLKITGKSQANQSQVTGEFTLANGKWESIPVDLLRANFKWNNGIFQLANFQASSKGIYELNARGSFPLGWGTVKPPHQRVELNANFSNSDLSILNFVETGFIRKAKGPFYSALSLKGKDRNLNLEGYVELKNCELGSPYLTRNLTNLHLKAKIDSNKFVIEKGEGKIGAGRLKLDGWIHSTFEDWELSFEDFNLRLATLEKSRVPIQVPELPVGQEKFGIPAIPSRGAPAFELRLTGKREKPKISGWIELEDTLFSYPPAKKSKKDFTLLRNVDWDLKLKTGRKTIFQNDYVHSKIEGELEFKREKIQGKVRSKEGSLSLYGSKFDLKEANFEITPTAPSFLAGGKTESRWIKNVSYLQFKAERTVEVAQTEGGKVQDTITVELERTPLTEEFDPAKIKFRSSQNPNLSSEKAASRAGVGIQLAGLTPEERDLELRKGIARILDSELVSPLARTIVQRTKLVDKIELVENPGAGRAPELRGQVPSLFDPLIGQSILLEKTLVGRLGIGYSATFDKIRDRLDFVHRVQLRYPFYKGFQLYGATELEAKETLGREPETKGGIRWETRFDPSAWFGKNKEKEKKE